MKQCRQNISIYLFPNRPFYIETVTPIPKDIVLVVDRSGSMGEVVGGETLMDIAIGAARTVVNTLSINDRVSVGVPFVGRESADFHGCVIAKYSMAW